MDNMTPDELEHRTKEFVIRCLKVVDALPNKASGRTIGSQLANSATSVGANFRASRRGRSRAEWFSKICIVVEECDETAYWLEIIISSGMLKPALIDTLHREAAELRAIFATTRRTARKS